MVSLESWEAKTRTYKLRSLLVIYYASWYDWLSGKVWPTTKCGIIEHCNCKNICLFFIIFFMLIKIIYKNIMLFYYITWFGYFGIYCCIFYFYFFFSSHIIFYKFFIILSHILSWKSGYSLSLDFYIDVSLRFLKLYFGFIRFDVVFFNSPSQVVSLFLSPIKFSE